MSGEISTPSAQSLTRQRPYLSGLVKLFNTSLSATDVQRGCDGVPVVDAVNLEGVAEDVGGTHPSTIAMSAVTSKQAAEKETSSTNIG